VRDREKVVILLSWIDMDKRTRVMLGRKGGGERESSP
jgi:hypothetical protein